MAVYKQYYDASDAFLDLYKEIHRSGKSIGPRGHKTTELEAVIIELINPRQRMILEQERKFKEVVACAEFLWYMTGSNFVKIITPFIPRWKEFSDDGEFVNSNYGVYWKRWIPKIINKLLSDEATRQAVMTIYKPNYLEESSKDVPCTVSIQFLIREKRLNMIVYMRSNDLWYGFCIDQFCFSLLQEFVLNELNSFDNKYELGTYTHFAGSLHLYENKLGKQMINHYYESHDINSVHTFTNFWQSLEKEVSNLHTRDYLASIIQRNGIDLFHFLKHVS